MSTVQELKKRADELRNKTAVNSITPDEVGSLIFDTIDYMYSIESSGIFKMMSSLADTTNPSAADQIPVIGAEIAQKASITTVVGKGLQNAETQTELDSVPVIRGTKVGQMAKSDIAVKLCESFEQNLPTYRPIPIPSTRYESARVKPGRVIIYRKRIWRKLWEDYCLLLYQKGMQKVMQT